MRGERGGVRLHSAVIARQKLRSMSVRILIIMASTLHFERCLQAAVCCRERHFLLVDWLTFVLRNNFPGSYKNSRALAGLLFQFRRQSVQLFPIKLFRPRKTFFQIGRSPVPHCLTFRQTSADAETSHQVASIILYSAMLSKGESSRFYSSTHVCQALFEVVI